MPISRTLHQDDRAHFPAFSRPRSLSDDSTLFGEQEGVQSRCAQRRSKISSFKLWCEESERFVVTNLCSFPPTFFLSGHAFSGGAHLSLKKFAESAVKLLKVYNTGAIVDGLIRVDVMCTANGNWVVNEFEGFEANFYSSKAREEYDAALFLEEYWLRKIEEILLRDKSNM